MTLKAVGRAYFRKLGHWCAITKKGSETQQSAQLWIFSPSPNLGHLECYIPLNDI